eukprot:12377149-Karenia_brevis.AAC.1
MASMRLTSNDQSVAIHNAEIPKYLAPCVRLFGCVWVRAVAGIIEGRRDHYAVYTRIYSRSVAVLRSVEILTI